MDSKELMDRDISSLSGGQRIKVVLACVLASKVKVLLLDNPLFQLDATSRNAFVRGLRLYAEKVRPTVFVCDRLDELFVPLATRLFALADGHLFEVPVECQPQ